MKKTMKNIITLAATLFSLTIFAQVGINNNTPQATLDITAKTTNGSKPEGLLAPRLTGDQIQAGDAQYTAAQKGLIIYATSAPTAPSGKTANMTAEGYYFFDGNAWQKITGGAAVSDATATTKGVVQLAGDLAGTAASPAIAADAVTSAKILDGTVANADLAAGTGGIYKGNGSLSGNTTVAQGANTLAFTSTATNGFSVDGTTLSVDAANNSVGIGTSTPSTSAALDISSTNKGILIPRVALTSATDATTITSPANGIIVYNTTTNINGPGMVINTGTPASPKWSSVLTYSDNSGAISGKLVYQSYPDATKTIAVGNLEFRAIWSGDTYFFQIRMRAAPAASLIYYCDRVAWFGLNNVTTTAAALTFTNANYNVWQTYTQGGIALLAGTPVGFLTYISSANDTFYYRINNHSKFNTNSFTSFVIEAF